MKLRSGNTGNGDMAAVARLDAAQMAGHRRLAAMHHRIVQRPPQHRRPLRPGARIPQQQGQIDALGLHHAGRQRHQARVVGGGQYQGKIGHGEILFGVPAHPGLALRARQPVIAWFGRRPFPGHT